MSTTNQSTTTSTTTAAGTGGWSSSNKRLDSLYQTAIKTLPANEIERAVISTPEMSLSSITEQVRSYLQPQYDESVRQRQAQTKQYKADIDADAYSRGMGSSTWVTDSKNRQLAAEASDIASLGSAYNANLAQNVAAQYENYLNRKASVDEINAANQIDVDKWNSQVRTALEQLAYERALEEYKRGDGQSSGGGSKRSSKRSSVDGITVTTDYVWDANSSQKGPVATGYVNFNDVSSSKKTSSAGGGATRYAQYR